MTVTALKLAGPSQPTQNGLNSSASNLTNSLKELQTLQNTSFNQPPITINQEEPKEEVQGWKAFWQCFPDEISYRRLFEVIFQLGLGIVGWQLAPKLGKHLKNNYEAKYNNIVENALPKKTLSALTELADPIKSQNKLQGFETTKFNEKNPLDWLKHFTGINLTNPFFGMLLGYVFGGFLTAKLRDYFQVPSVEDNLLKRAEDPAKLKKELHNPFYILASGFVQLAAAITVGSWFKNPIARILGVVTGFGLGEVLVMIERFLTKRVENFLDQTFENLTGSKTSEDSGISLIRSLSRGISISLITLFSVLFFLPKKKIVIATYEKD
ncbi:MAG TPA: hypothetical protein V6C96_04145, partial [Vampirovibrionales bacterium]